MGEFSVGDVDGKVPWDSSNTTRSRLRELQAAGQVTKTEEAKGPNPAKYMVVADAPAMHGLILPQLQLEKNFVLETSEIVADKT